MHCSHLRYDAENRLAGVSGAATASFVYDGDGRRVKGTVNGVTSYYISDQYDLNPFPLLGTVSGFVQLFYDLGDPWIPRG